MNTNELNPNAIRECLRLVRQPPDEKLLLRYYESHILGLGWKRALSKQELRWVEANLTGNVRWQASYRRIQRSGPIIRMSSSIATRCIAAAMILLAAPIWIFAIYVAGGPSDRTVQVVYGEAAEVIRGDAKRSLRLPDDFTPFTAPSLSSLRDLRTKSSSVTQLAQLRDDLEASYQVSRDRVERAEIAYVMAQISQELNDQRGVRTWQARCQAEEAFDCRVLATDGVR